MATIDLGRLGFVNKGTYNNSTTYEKNDLVQFTDGGILSTYLYIDSTAQSGQAPSSSGTAGSRWVYFAKGVADAVASAGNNKVLVTDGSGNLSPVSIGSAGQSLKVNSGANGFEFGTISTGTFSIHAIDHYNYKTQVTSGSANTDYVDISGGNYVQFQPTSTNDIIFFSYCTSIENPSGDRGCDIYLMMKAGSTSIGSGDTKLDYSGRHATYSGTGGNYLIISKNLMLPCTSLSTSTTYYVEVAGGNYNTGGNRFNVDITSSQSGDYREQNLNMIHFKA